MNNKELTISNLEKFEKSPNIAEYDQLLNLKNYLSEDSYSKHFFKRQVDKFLSYKNKYPELISKYIPDIVNYKHVEYLNYSQEERAIIKTIQINYYDAFYALSIINNFYPTIIEQDNENSMLFIKYFNDIETNKKTILKIIEKIKQWLASEDANQINKQSDSKQIIYGKNNKIKMTYNLTEKMFKSGNVCYILQKARKAQEIMQELSKNNKVYKGTDRNINSINSNIKKNFNIEKRLIVGKKLNEADFDFSFDL